MIIKKKKPSMKSVNVNETGEKDSWKAVQFKVGGPISLMN